MIEYLKAIAKEVVEMKINDKSFFGRNLVVNNESIVIDGNVVSQKTPKIKVEILGSCDSISTMSGDVSVNSTAKTINTQSGDVQCADVFGGVTTMSGDVNCGKISGSVKTMSGDIHSKDRRGL